MAYYIAPAPDSFLESHSVIAYRVVKRLKDFKAEDGKKYRVFKSKKEMRESPYIPIYLGVAGRLKKSQSEFVLRF